MQMLPAHDQPGPCGPGCHVDKVSDLGNLGTLRNFARSASCVVPAAVRVCGVDAADSRMNTGVRTSDNSETDVTGPAPVNEPFGAPRRIGTDLQLHGIGRAHV